MKFQAFFLGLAGLTSLLADGMPTRSHPHADDQVVLRDPEEVATPSLVGSEKEPRVLARRDDSVSVEDTPTPAQQPALRSSEGNAAAAAAAPEPRSAQMHCLPGMRCGNPPAPVVAAAAAAVPASPVAPVAKRNDDDDDDDDDHHHHKKDHGKKDHRKMTDREKKLAKAPVVHLYMPPSDDAAEPTPTPETHDTVVPLAGSHIIGSQRGRHGGHGHHKHKHHFAPPTVPGQQGESAFPAGPAADRPALPTADTPADAAAAPVKRDLMDRIKENIKDNFRSRAWHFRPEADVKAEKKLEKEQKAENKLLYPNGKVVNLVAQPVNDSPPPRPTRRTRHSGHGHGHGAEKLVTRDAAPALPASPAEAANTPPHVERGLKGYWREADRDQKVDERIEADEKAAAKEAGPKTVMLSASEDLQTAPDPPRRVRHGGHGHKNHEHHIAHPEAPTRPATAQHPAPYPAEAHPAPDPPVLDTYASAADAAGAHSDADPAVHAKCNDREKLSAVRAKWEDDAAVPRGELTPGEKVAFNTGNKNARGESQMRSTGPVPPGGVLYKQGKPVSGPVAGHGLGLDKRSRFGNWAREKMWGGDRMRQKLHAGDSWLEDTTQRAGELTGVALGEVKDGVKQGVDDVYGDESKA